MVPLFVCKHKSSIMPKRTGFQSIPGLFCTMLFQHLHHGGGGGDGAPLVVFGWGKDIFSGATGDVLELPVNVDRPPLQVNGLPGQAASLRPAQSGKEHGQVDGLETVSLDSIHKGPDGLPVQRLDLPAL